MYQTPKARNWTFYEAERKKLQKRNRKFSRASLCRRAGISETTMYKGLKAEGVPIPKVRGQIELVLEAERIAQEMGAVQ